MLTSVLVELHGFARKSNTLDSDGPARLSNLNTDLNGSRRKTRPFQASFARANPIPRGRSRSFAIRIRNRNIITVGMVGNFIPFRQKSCRKYSEWLTFRVNPSQTSFLLPLPPRSCNFVAVIKCRTSPQSKLLSPSHSLSSPLFSFHI